MKAPHPWSGRAEFPTPRLAQESVCKDRYSSLPQRVRTWPCHPRQPPGEGVLFSAPSRNSARKRVQATGTPTTTRSLPPGSELRAPFLRNERSSGVRKNLGSEAQTSREHFILAHATLQ